MRKRIISAFLAIVMIVCIMPFGSKNAYAADELPWSDLLLDGRDYMNIKRVFIFNTGNSFTCSHFDWH